jgi:hypothetical protein
MKNSSDAQIVRTAAYHACCEFFDAISRTLFDLAADGNHPRT